MRNLVCCHRTLGPASPRMSRPPLVHGCCSCCQPQRFSGELWQRYLADWLAQRLTWVARRQVWMEQRQAWATLERRARAVQQPNASEATTVSGAGAAVVAVTAAAAGTKGEATAAAREMPQRLLTVQPWVEATWGWALRRRHCRGLEAGLPVGP